MDEREINICAGCDLPLEKEPVFPSQEGRCPRCGSVLATPRKDSINRTLAVSLTGLLLFIPAIFYPLLSLDAMGLEEHGSIWDSFIAFLRTGYPFVAIVVLLTSIVLPLAKLLILFITSLCLRVDSYPPNLPLLLRIYHHLQEWGMDEVYLISLFVTLIKVYDMADITYETGFFSFLGMVFTTVCLSFIVDRGYFWEMIDQNSPKQETSDG